MGQHSISPELAAKAARDIAGNFYINDSEIVPTDAIIIVSGTVPGIGANVNKKRIALRSVEQLIATSIASLKSGEDYLFVRERLVKSAENKDQAVVLVRSHWGLIEAIYEKHRVGFTAYAATRIRTDNLVQIWHLRMWIDC